MRTFFLKLNSGFDLRYPGKKYLNFGIFKKIKVFSFKQARAPLFFLIPGIQNLYLWYNYGQSFTGRNLWRNRGNSHFRPASAAGI